MNNFQEISDEFQKRDCELGLYRKEDEKGLYEIFQEVIDAGTNYPHDDSSYEEFQRSFFAPGSCVYVCRSKEGVVGGFYLKSNFPGRAKHIANAAYMIKNSSRGNGLGRLFVESSLHIAKGAGYQAIQFNLVLSQNLPAINLYNKLGFHIIGTIPQAIRNADGSYQDGYIMHRRIT